ncbi:MAG: ribonuclease HII [Holosporales bacterium]|jgi:ribonuclease HII|nr:ribonuclease HII [Holosporales bacterium]
MPSFEFGDQIAALHGLPVAGVDEVGRGPLAGPVVAGAVVITDQSAFLAKFADVNDSKALSKKHRERLSENLTQSDCVHFAIGEASPQEIDRVNIRNATFLAIERALAALTNKLGCPLSYIVDGNALPAIAMPGAYLVKGDAKSYRIAAASIIAKVYRDNLMESLGRDFPEYNWAANAGYGTKAHIEALVEFGPSPHHRMTFAKVKQ